MNIGSPRIRSTNDQKKYLSSDTVDLGYSAGTVCSPRVQYKRSLMHVATHQVHFGGIKNCFVVGGGIWFFVFVFIRENSCSFLPQRQRKGANVAGLVHLWFEPFESGLLVTREPALSLLHHKGQNP